MTDHQAQIDAVAVHHYAITLREGEDLVQLSLHADPATVALIATDQLDERRLVQETLRYLVRRQRADELPPALDLADVAAGYDTWIEEMRTQMRLHRRAGRSQILSDSSIDAKEEQGLT